MKPDVSSSHLHLSTEGTHLMGDTYKRCRVPVYNRAHGVVGYMRLPSAYKNAWIALCFKIVYWAITWKYWNLLEKKMQDDDKSVCHELGLTAATRLLHLLKARFILVHLPSLAEAKANNYHEELSTVERGAIKGFSSTFNKTSRLGIQFMWMKAFEPFHEHVHDPNAQYSTQWHERQEPLICFLTEREDVNFDHHQPSPSSDECDDDGDVDEGFGMDQAGDGTGVLGDGEGGGSVDSNDNDNGIGIGAGNIGGGPTGGGSGESKGTAPGQEVADTGDES
ncbi:hypothetical protein F5I97DRAFT_1830348 [Phlebopus sp. FC_14]|nr:hypothetical protein F5I97DRAFT_1830348 [Phlebopus sp. FC_14]